MTDAFQARTREVQRRLRDASLDLLLVTDPDSVYYLTGFWGYLGLEFGRPTVFAVPANDDPVLVTPRIEAAMARDMTWVHDIRIYVDGVGREWREPMDGLLDHYGRGAIAVEQAQLPGLLATFLCEALGTRSLADGTSLLAAMRMIKKSPEEIAILRQAGEVAVAMVDGGRTVIGDGVPEYEVALAMMAAGTRKAAAFLDASDPRFRHSPMIFNLPVLQSGPLTRMSHRHPSVRRLEHRDPVYMCCCGVATFRRYWPGFDRTYFVGTVPDHMGRAYELALAAEHAVLDALRPGVTAEEAFLAGAEIYRQAGREPGHRVGRAIGHSFVETPQLKHGDRTRLQPGMVLCIDGSVTVQDSFGTHVCDTVVLTGTGYEVLTEYPRGLEAV